ncbi:helix-turn-helix domain-containing protein [Catenulispora sp. NF23]|uniref:Helix-turn-helix domain-containing protein n=1 Tax=Catenulispora pinistramenti TaxID=2705254 RepID=A0ABS5KUU5_9ACTN|nr:XRE family transcriptional regulator [Catenulispora pinistramenti]MBS2538149.1 helix-turn-helix domain-containing protein [Catenulispora pinistramenti]MBS2549823.1 helix-turn-helix domain-containing protein [Catenulispora pinistramenti]
MDDQLAADIGTRLRTARRTKALTLADAAAATGISVSTLSRLETGGRRATLEQLLPLADLYEAALDELVGRAEPPRKQGDGRVIIPLTKEPGGLRAYKMTLPPRRDDDPSPELRTHEGWEWMYVLSGRLRVLLAEHDLTLGKGEAAEFDTHVPHWFGAAGPVPVELLTLFGPQGERVHVRARSRGQWG